MLTSDRLPVGVTSFGKPPEMPTLPAKQFTTACHAAARLAGGFVGWVAGCEGQAAVNFHRASPWLAEQRILVLCNYLYPFLAFVPTGQAGFGQRTFLAPGPLGQAFAEATDLQPLDLAFLTAPLAPGLLEVFHVQKRHELRYWRGCSMAECVDDVIFNNWD